MIALVSTVIGIVLKLLQLGARIALNRVTIIVTFVGGIAATLTALYSSLSDTSSVLSTATQKISSVSMSLGNWVSGNDYLQLIGYGLSLDTLTDGIVSSFIFVFCTLSGFLITALFTVFLSVAPLLADLAISALKNQFIGSVGGSK